MRVRGVLCQCSTVHRVPQKALNSRFRDLEVDQDKLERHSQNRSAWIGTLLGKGRGSGRRQTRVASECGPRHPHGHGLNQGQGQSGSMVVYLYQR